MAVYWTPHAASYGTRFTTAQRVSAWRPFSSKLVSQAQSVSSIWMGQRPVEEILATVQEARRYVRINSWIVVDSSRILCTSALPAGSQSWKSLVKAPKCVLRFMEVPSAAPRNASVQRMDRPAEPYFRRHVI